MEDEMYTLQKGTTRRTHCHDGCGQRQRYVLCYDDRDKSFVCQGRNYEEIVQSFKERFPNRIFFINDRFKKYFPEDFKQSKFAIQTEE